MENIKVSVVVPVYNVELYLNKCIESIVNQSYKNLEIILVDDGSPDKCPSMCDDWAKKDKRIKVIHKKNAGLGNARNTGIENATGEYICFVDSDDIIDKNTIEACCNKLFDFDYDIIHYGFKKMDLDGNIFKYQPTTSLKDKYVGIDEVKKILPLLVIGMPKEYAINVNLSACMCLINMNLIKKAKWKFVSERDIISEDVYSLLKLYKNIQSGYILKDTFYSYRLNPKSLTTTYRKDRFEKVKILHKELIGLFPDDGSMIERFDYLFLSYTISCLKSIVGSDMPYFYKLKEINKIVNDKLIKKYINIYIKKESITRKIYFTFVKFKFLNSVYFLSFLQNRFKR